MCSKTVSSKQIKNAFVLVPSSAVASFAAGLTSEPLLRSAASKVHVSAHALPRVTHITDIKTQWHIRQFRSSPPALGIWEANGSI
jgi:hypothetical protein